MNLESAPSYQEYLVAKTEYDSAVDMFGHQSAEAVAAAGPYVELEQKCMAELGMPTAF